MKSILVIEDDSDIAYSLKYNLERSGEYEVVIAEDGRVGLDTAADTVPDLVILDLNLPGLDGLEVCERLRQDDRTTSVPIIMLTARIDESQKISGLDMGADDYVTKPFSVKELMARVRAVLRRSEEADVTGEVLTDGPIIVDLQAHRVTAGGNPVELTRKEFDLLTTLLRNRGLVLTRDRLLEQVWGYLYPGETRTVDVHVRRLRQKLGEPGRDAIETVVGVGYRYRRSR